MPFETGQGLPSGASLSERHSVRTIKRNDRKQLTYGPFLSPPRCKGSKGQLYVGNILVGDPNENASVYPKTYQKRGMADGNLPEIRQQIALHTS